MKTDQDLPEITLPTGGSPRERRSIILNMLGLARLTELDGVSIDGRKDERLLTTQEIAYVFSVDVSTVRNWVKNGKLAALVLPNSSEFRYRPADVRMFLKTLIENAQRLAKETQEKRLKHYEILLERKIEDESDLKIRRSAILIAKAQRRAEAEYRAGKYRREREKQLQVPANEEEDK